MRLIDADKLERQEYWGNERCFDYVDAEDIDNAPTVDAVPVVRCKDCKHYDIGGSCIICGFQSRKPDDFCSYGERKEGAE
nr:MAG TPA: RecR protein [Caudoviricetes sp.]